MIVTVEGVITSITVKEKDGKKFTNVYLAQRGIKEQVHIKLEGDQSAHYTEFELNNFTGRLQTWKQSDGIGKMVLV